MKKYSFCSVWGFVLLGQVCIWPATIIAQDMWKAKAPTTSFVADWTDADRIDAEASQYFLQHIWPKIKPVAESLNSELAVETGKRYSGTLSPEEQNAGIVSFFLPVEQELPWYMIPTEDQVRQRTLTTFAAQGQSKALCIGVHALRDVHQVTVLASDLAGPTMIPASAITSRFNLSYTIDARRKGKISARQMMLLKVESWNLPQAHTYQWVLDVHVPVNAVAGIYRGKISVLVKQTVAAEFDLELEVLPFRLTDNGCRWGAFMTPNPAYTTQAWCDLNARYEFNSLAWWYLDDPYLAWTWDGYQEQVWILAKLRNREGTSFKGKELQELKKQLPEWLQKRFQGEFLFFAPDEIEGYWGNGKLLPLPEDLSPQSPAYKQPLQLQHVPGGLSPELARLICFDRPGKIPNFDEQAMETIHFQQDEAFQQFDAGMQRLKRYGFVGPITWFSAGKTPQAWDVRVVAHRFGQTYSQAGWTWQPEVTETNSNHRWYLANAAIAKTFSEAIETYGWPEVVWCPRDESLDAHGTSGRAAANMIGEMMPYIRHYATDARIYSVVWQTQEDNWKGMWQAGVLQKYAQKTDSEGKSVPSSKYGPYHVISTNCPNDLDREITWDADGEYWLYTFITSTVRSFVDNRFFFGFWGARHYAAVFYNYADDSVPQNLQLDQDIRNSVWLTGHRNGLETLNFYLSQKADGRSIDCALASHAMLACREGIQDRKYVETLRVFAYKHNSRKDIEFLKNLPQKIETIEHSHNALEQLRLEIAMRIKALVTRELQENR